MKGGLCIYLWRFEAYDLHTYMIPSSSFKTDTDFS